MEEMIRSIKLITCQVLGKKEREKKYRKETKGFISVSIPPIS